MLTTQELLELRVKAEKFTDDNLEECCKEMVEWRNSGVLQQGKVRELASLLSYAGYHALALAESEISRKAIDFVVTGQMSGLPKLSI